MKSLCACYDEAKKDQQLARAVSTWSVYVADHRGSAWRLAVRHMVHAGLGRGFRRFASAVAARRAACAVVAALQSRELMRGWNAWVARAVVQAQVGREGWP